MRNILLAVAALLALATPTMGGHCGQFRQKVYRHHYVKAVQVHAAPYYLVGQPVRNEAYDAKLAKRAAQEALAAYVAQAGKFRGEGRFVIEGEVGVSATAGGTVGGDVGTSIPDAGGGAVGYPDGASALITRKCLSCHAGENAKGGLDLTLNIDRATASEIFVRTFSNDPAIRMPPDGSLTDDERQVFFNLSEAVLKQGSNP